MPKYRCYGLVTGSKFLGVVESANEKEAIEKAEELSTCYVSICAQCAHEIDEPTITKIVVEEGE